MKIVKATILALVITLLNACSFIKPIDKYNLIESKNDSSLASSISIPSIPADWEYLSCPNYLEKFSNCDFEIPLPQRDSFDAESGTHNYFWNDGYSNIPSVHFTNVSYYNRRYNSMSLADISCEQGSSVCRKLDYTINKGEISVARFQYENNYSFFIKTPKMVLLVTGPTKGEAYSPSVTDENVKLLETSLLNIRLK